MKAETLYPFQAQAMDAIRRLVRPLCVAPTGAGKGWMIAHQAALSAEAGRRVLVLAHRREIVLDLRDRAASLHHRVCAILPGEVYDRDAPIKIASTHSLLASEALPDADELILDEAHHYAADEYIALTKRFGDIPRTGYTATPQRSDGRGMVDAFDVLYQVATYRQLLELGKIVPCDIMRPSMHTGMDMAQDPVDAYMQHGAQRAACFMFVRDVDTANRCVYDLRSKGVPAAVIHHETSSANRKRHLDDLRSGTLRVVVNAYTMTEGVDVARVDTIVLARNSEHAGAYVQMTGRALRSCRGKSKALLIDLHGVSHLHGAPTEDRPMSLDGRGMGHPRAHVLGHEPPRDPVALGLDLEFVHAEQANRAGPDSTAPIAVIPEQLSDKDTKQAYWERLKAERRRGKISRREAVSAFLAQQGRSARKR